MIIRLSFICVGPQIQASDELFTWSDLATNLGTVGQSVRYFGKIIPRGELQFFTGL